MYTSTCFRPCSIALRAAFSAVDLRGVGRALARALEVLRASAAPRDHVAVGIADGHHGIVKRRANMDPAARHRLPLAATLSPGSSLGSFLRHSSCVLLLATAAATPASFLVRAPRRRPRRNSSGERSKITITTTPGRHAQTRAERSRPEPMRLLFRGGLLAPRHRLARATTRARIGARALPTHR